MNSAEFSTWDNRAALLFDDVKRFVEGRGRDSGSLLREWQRVLVAVDSADANAVLDMMLDGSVPRGEYFDVGRFPNVVVHEVRSIASARIRRQQEQRRFGAEPTFRCVTCRDTGLVNAWNPQFVEAYRAEFIKIRRTPRDRNAPPRGSLLFDLDRFDPEREITIYDYDPPTWQTDAARWWRGQRAEGGTIHHVTRCKCGGQRSRLFLEERQKFINNDRRVGTIKDAGVPACGMADYNARVMPLKTSDGYEDLLDWYATHDPMSVYEWQANPAQYAGEF